MRLTAEARAEGCSEAPMSAVIQDGELSSLPEENGYIDEFGDLPKSPTTQATFVVFDDFVIEPTTSTTFLSNTLMNGLLGAFDQLAIQVVTDRALGTGLMLSAQIAHSGDGHIFTAKAATPELISTPVSTSGTTVFPVAYDDGTIPSLAFVRLVFVVNATLASFKLRVKCTVTGNNRQERAFTEKIVRYTEKFVLTDSVKDCSDWMEGGTSFTYDLCYTRKGTKLTDNHRIEQAYNNGAPFPGAAKAFFLFNGKAWPSVEPSSCDGPPNRLTLRKDYRACFRPDGTMVIFRGQVPVGQTSPPLSTYSHPHRKHS
jgi:hypothetical protein